MSTFKLNDEKMFADVTDGIAIIINSETGIYYGFNGFATNVYENLERGVDSEAILAEIKTLEGTPSTIDEDFSAFIKAIIDYELMTETSSSDEKPSIDASIAKEDNFALSLKEYNDAQELLLADPIHEVKEETGWTPEKDSIGYSKKETKEREGKIEE